MAGDSSDLAASDHMLEVEAGTPRVLPPQQEQVSAAAPTTLTVGCIIAIVFGVLVSLVILVGKLWIRSVLPLSFCSSERVSEMNCFCLKELDIFLLT